MQGQASLDGFGWAYTGGMAKGNDHIVVTSQHYRSPDSSFKETVSEYELHVFLSVLILSVFI